MKTPHRPSRTFAPLALVLWSILFAGLIAQVLLTAYEVAYQIPYPFPRNYGEGIALDRALALARGEALYTPADRPPFITWNFPPLYAWVCSLGAAWRGPSFAFGRAVSTIAMLAIAALVFLLARKSLRGLGAPAGTGTRWAAAAGLLFLGSGPVSQWAAVVRCDPLGVALGLGGLAAAWAGLSPVLAGVLFGLALLCKQSLIAALLAACVGYARLRQWRSLRLALTACVLTGGPVCLWQQGASGGWFLHHAVLSNKNAWVFAQLRTIVVDGLAPYLPLVLLAGLTTVAILRTPRAGRDDACIFGTSFAGRDQDARGSAAAGLGSGAPTVGGGEGQWVRGPTAPGRGGVGSRGSVDYLLGAAVVAALAGKIGADSNYLLDFMAAICILSAHGGAWLEAGIDRRLAARRRLPEGEAPAEPSPLPPEGEAPAEPWPSPLPPEGEAPAEPLPPPRAALGAGAAVVALLVGFQVWLGFRPPIPRDAYYAAVPQGRVLLGKMAEVSGPVIAEEPGLVPAARKPLWFQPFEFTQMALAGTWDQRPFVDALRRGEFPLVVLRFDPHNPACRDPEGTWRQGRFTHEMVEAIRAAYRPSEIHAGRLLLRPAAPPRDAGLGHRLR